MQVDILLYALGLVPAFVIPGLALSYIFPKVSRRNPHVVYLCMLAGAYTYLWIISSELPLSHLWAQCLFFSLFGAFAEWGVGYALAKILTRDIWVYRWTAIGKYTSWYSVGLWGIGGVLLSLISHVF